MEPFFADDARWTDDDKNQHQFFRDIFNQGGASARGRLSDQVEDLCKISVINFLKKYSQYIL